MNMEVDGAVDLPLEQVPVEPALDNGAEKQEAEPKTNGTTADINNIHEEVDLDLLKVEFDSADGSDSEEEFKDLKEDANDEDIDDIDIKNEYVENSKDNHDDSNQDVSNVDNTEVINISNSSQDDSNTVNDHLDDDLIDEIDNSENLNNESNENSDSGVKKTTGAHNENVHNNDKVQPKPVEKMQLRRSSRGIKRKRYDDVEPEIEERKMPHLINAYKIKTPNNKQILPKNIVNHIANIPNLYQKVLGPNTTLTPISVKNKNLTIKPAPSVPQPAILPSLTDDMFVVEAPSFIVPYVYEKPPIEPFKQYIEKLRAEVAEEKLKCLMKKKENSKKLISESTDEKEEKNVDTEKPSSTITKEDGLNLEDDQQANKNIAKLENKEDKTDTDGENPESDEKDEVKESEGDSTIVEDSVEKEKKKKNPDDDESWEGDSSDSKDSDSDKELESSVGNKSKKLEYFDLTLGKFFSKIGLNLVKQFVQNDLLKQQTRKLSREKRAGQMSKATQVSILSLKKNLAVSDKKCEPFIFEQHKCKFCSFKSESRLALSHHLETPHMKNNMYRCNFCTFEVKGPHDILFHMETEHGIRARLERPPAYHQCQNCPFEDNGKGKLARHQIACAKRFKPNLNLAPPFEWEPPAKILTARAKAPIMNPYQYNFNRIATPMMNNHIGKSIVNNILPGNSFRPRLRTPVSIPRASSVQGISILRGGATIRPSIPASAFIQNNFPSSSKSKLSNHPSISITPLPRQVLPQRQTVPSNKDGCVICEICDGYIKDLEQLRSHMQWIHRVKIHPKMMTNSPPLNCQKCQLRFFTDQGLERHLLGSHGLVTKSMQEEANKGNDGGRCPICGRVYQWKLLDHVGRDHKMNLKPAHLSYKCTVCSAIFGLYKQFENHVYSAHSVVAKRVMNKGKSLPPSKIGNSILKPLRNREDLTITPSSGRTLSSDED